MAVTGCASEPFAAPDRSMNLVTTNALVVIHFWIVGYPGNCTTTPNASHGCRLYLQPGQYGCGLYLEPGQYGCGLYLEPAQ